VHAMQAVAEMLLLLSCDSDLIQLYNWKPGNTEWHKKGEILKNPTKIEEMQQNYFVDKNWTIITCLLRNSLLNSEVVCSSRSLFRSTANCTWLPLRISKVPVFCVTLYFWSTGWA
jgi:hypothetical protein